jgi:hypothetical protein
MRAPVHASIGLTAVKESPFEIVYHPGNVPQQLLERWNNRFDFSRPELLKRYLRGDLRIHLHASFRTEIGVTQLCVDISAVKRDSSNHDTFLGRDFESTFHPVGQHEQVSVLVDVIKVREDCKGMVLRGETIGSVARLVFREHCPDVRGNAWYFGPIERLPVRRVCEHGEGTSGQHSFQVAGPRDRNEQASDEVVQARSQQEQSLASQDAQSSRGRLLKNAMMQMPTLRIELRAVDVRVQSMEISHCAFQVDDIFVSTT